MLTLFFVFGILCPARAERPTAPRAGQYELGVEASYFSTDTNYDSGGTSRTLFNGSGLTNVRGDLRVEYDFSRVWRAFAGVSYAQTHTDSLDPLGTTRNVKRDNAGMNDATVGGLAWFTFDQVAVVPQVQLTYPFWHVSETSDSPLVGEGAMSLQAGGWAIWHLGMFYPYGFAAFEYRDSGRASLFPYAVGVNVRPNIWWAQAEYRGFMTIANDSDVENRGVRDVYLTQVNGGSYRFYAVNPNAAEIALETGLRFRNGIGLKIGYATMVSGANYAKGDTFYGGISYQGRPKPPPAPPPTPITTDPSGFKVESDHYDETLFQTPPVDDSKKIKKRVRKKP